jgi:ubiquitin C-terminal hydrolase
MKFANEFGETYHLCALSVFKGKAEKGHYITLIPAANESWWFIDDQFMDSISSFQMEKLLENIYLIFFEKSDQ